MSLAVVLALATMVALNANSASASVDLARNSLPSPSERIGNDSVHLATESLLAGAPGMRRLSAVFTPEVRHWEPQILAWSDRYGVDAQMVAILMQVESCGDPYAVSIAGAQGLFQVMPFHFDAGEDMLDPETNAGRGLSYFAERLAQTQGDIGRAFAGYNGGHIAAAGNWDSWYDETQRYFVWTTGIYQDIVNGKQVSETLRRWLAAGGHSLCRQAAASLGIG